MLLKNLLLLLSILIILSCSQNSLTSNIRAKYNKETNVLQLNLYFNINITRAIEENLEKFSYANIYLDIFIFNKNKEQISNAKIIRFIKFDRWNNVYILKDSSDSLEKKYYSFKDLSDKILNFYDINMKVNNSFINPVLIKYDFYLKSIELAPPFKIIEDNDLFGNIKRTNKEITVYAKE